jgi:hypothetical protein
VLGGARAVGSLLVVGAAGPTAAGPDAASMQLAGPGVLTVAVAADPADLRARLAQTP